MNTLDIGLMCDNILIPSITLLVFEHASNLTSFEVKSLELSSYQISSIVNSHTNLEVITLLY